MELLPVGKSFTPAFKRDERTGHAGDDEASKQASLGSTCCRNNWMRGVLEEQRRTRFAGLVVSFFLVQTITRYTMYVGG